MKLDRKEKRAERTLDLTHLVESDEETPQTKRPRQRENVQRSPDGSVGGSGRKGVGLEEKIVSSGNNFESRGRRESHGEEYDTDAEEEAAAPIADIRYYNGTIKTISYKISFSPTPAPSSSRSVAATSHGSITVEGMIGPTSRKLQRVLLLSFDFDLAEFLKKIPDHVPLLCVTQNEPRILRNLERERGNVYWFESPGANAFCSQHAKALVLYYEHSVRIVISTANWSRDISQIANLCYIHDFPRLATPFLSREMNTTITPGGLVHSFLIFLESGVGLHSFFPDFTDSLATDFELSSIGPDADVVLVWSIKPTSRVDAIWSEETVTKLGGFSSLARAVRKLRRFEGGSYSIELCGSSVNKSPRAFIKSLLAACSGISPTPDKFHTLIDGMDVTKVKLVYPTAKHEKKYGLRARYAAGSIEDIGKRQYDKKEKKRDDPNYENCRELTKNEIDIAPHLLHTLQNSGSGPMLVHAKTILIIHTPPVESDGTPEGFLYLGSHNSTQAAWGRMSYDPAKFASNTVRQPYCNQAELGVLVRLDGTTIAEIDACAAKFLPYQRPLKRFGTKDKLFVFQEKKILRGRGHSDSEDDLVADRGPSGAYHVIK